MDVLLVEDNAGDRRLAREAFRSSARPLTPHVVNDGVEALAAMAAAFLLIQLRGTANAQNLEQDGYQNR
jgi:CheY-like chemotaxis protein